MAARNCLVETNGAVVGALKLTDFGMARHMDANGCYKLEVKQMPTTWCAIESLEKFEWYMESDWWSWAVLSWEVSAFLFPHSSTLLTFPFPFQIFTDALMPYNETVFDNKDQLAKFFRASPKNRLEIPAEVPRPVAAVMKKCWELERSNRPKPNEILDATK